jgi:hypothetical protein
MKFDAAAPPADLNRCDECGKPKGYKGYQGPECQCDQARRSPAGFALDQSLAGSGVMRHRRASGSTPCWKFQHVETLEWQCST